MKIVYNLASLVQPRTGIGRYTQNLMTQLLAHPEIADVSGMLSRHVFSQDKVMAVLEDTSSSQQLLLAKSKHIVKKILRNIPGTYALREKAQQFLAAPRWERFNQKGYVYHETNFIPKPYSGKMVITVHDLSFMRYPECHPKLRVNYLKRHLPFALQRADKIITDSEFVRQEILACYPTVNADKIIAIALGVDPIFQPYTEQQVAEVLKKWRLSYKKYIFSVCTLEPRKNLVRLIKAFASLPKSLRQEYPLVLVGNHGWGMREFYALAEPLLQAGELISTGYVAQVDLPALYAGARIFAYPSLYEGFGLPVLEAMAAGVAVLTSNVSSLPEVVLDAGITVNPLSEEEIAAGLLQLQREDVSEACSRKGLAYAKMLPWHLCAEKTLAVYRDLAG